MSGAKRRPKRNTKQEQIAATIRRQIIAGQLTSGTKLPTYEVLEEEFDVSRMTMQQAMGLLKNDGFVNAVERRGMFVSNRVPHLNRFGFLLPSHERNNHFWELLLSQAKCYAEEMGYEIVVYRRLGRDHESSSEWERLMEDLKAERIGGMFIPFPLQECRDLSVFEDSSFPKIVFSETDVSNASLVVLNNKEFVVKALDYFIERKHDKVAFLCQWGKPPIYYYFIEEVKKRGMQTKEAWQFSLQNYETADNVIQLLMSLPTDQCPNAVFIADDHLTEHASRGLIKSGVKLGDEVTVVAHHNWSGEFKPLLPIQYIGYDIRDIITKSIGTMRQFQQTHQIKTEEGFDPLFQGDFNSQANGNLV
jgi:DNA-binding LacI/PurR family transcriptional regulator